MGIVSQCALRAFVSDETGATAIEYALLGSLISVAIIGAVMALNESMVDMYDYIRSFLVPAIGG